MIALSYTSFRAKLANVLDTLQINHTPVLITRQKGSNAVVMSEEDFRAYEETAYLMQSNNNAQRLNSSIEQLRAGNGTKKELLD